MLFRSLACFLRMFNSSKDEWVAGLDVEYTTVLESEKILKEAEKKKPAVIQVCVHNVCLVYHICHADVECQDFKNFLEDKTVKFVTVDFKNDKEVLLRSPEELAGALSSALNADPGRSHGSSFVPQT